MSISSTDSFGTQTLDQHRGSAEEGALGKPSSALELARVSVQRDHGKRGDPRGLSLAPWARWPQEAAWRDEDARLRVRKKLAAFAPRH